MELQARAGGNASIGRELYPLMVEAGLEAVGVSPRMVYVDSSRPELVDRFTSKTFTAMIEGVREPALAGHRTTGADGVFCCTFFRGVGRRRGPAPRVVV